MHRCMRQSNAEHVRSGRTVHPASGAAARPKLTKLQRMRLYAEAAPIIRARLLDFDRTKRVRPIFVRKSDGTTERLTPHEYRIRLLVSELTRLGIEIDTSVNAGVRPLALYCACGLPYLVPQDNRRIPGRCQHCERNLRLCCGLVNGQRCTRVLGTAASALAKRPASGRLCRSCCSRAKALLPNARRQLSLARAAVDLKRRGEAIRKSYDRKAEAERARIRAARVAGMRASDKYARTHRPKERRPCAVCGHPSTASSDRSARKFPGTKAYCAAHPRGRSRA